MENAVGDGTTDLKRFLDEAELHHYFDLFKDVLKVTKLSQLKYVATEDLTQIGLSKPEQRRYKKLYNKYFPNPYIYKIKKLFNPAKQNELYLPGQSPISADFMLFKENNVKVSTKHIIPMEDITINKELGMGQFGVVQQGTWNTGDQRLQVAIKCLGNERMTSNSTEFLKEAAVMHSIEHPNIVRLYGVVLHLDSLMLVTELAPLRSLLECLREVSLRTDFTVPTLCDFAEQISDGMSYLENKRLIHRDLAARNILVFRKNRVKISDFGLSRALGVGKDYYQTNYNVNLKLPVAWCAPECILYLRFTSASDVWAFGVCLWEMFTYGFQPWAAFSGQQILEAIDCPNYQRLERPDCCPDTYYNLMLECWSHDLNDRPKFKDISTRLREIRPEQVQAISNFSKQEQTRRTNFLDYKTGQIITVLGKENMTKSSMWYGVLPGGACGMFDPTQTVPYVKSNKSIPFTPRPHSSSSTNSPRPLILRTDMKRHTYTGKRTIRRDMISRPQGDVKQTGHIGLDGAYFGDISFLDPAGCPPRQVVTPYKPSEDLEQIPLINPHSPSHLSGASCTPPYALLSAEGKENATACDEVYPDCDKATKNNSKSSHGLFSESRTNKNFLDKVKCVSLCRHLKTDGNDAAVKPEESHEYHEISDTDTDMMTEQVDTFVLPENSKCSSDFSQSLINEMECLFRNHSRHNEEITGSKINEGVARTHSTNKIDKKKDSHTDSMKPMSAHDEKTLETAVALANEITIKSMSEVESDKKVPQSPSDRSKFHFKFSLASLHHHNNSHEVEKDGSDKHEKRNFSEAARSVPDIQSTITEESKLAYTSLIEEPTPSSSLISQIAKDTSEIHMSNTIPKTTRGQFTCTDRSSQFNSLQKQLLPTIESRHLLASTSTSNEENVNPLQLPPRSTKPKLVEKARHIRKYPLKIPTNNYNESESSAASKLPIIYQNAVPPPSLNVQAGPHETQNGTKENIDSKGVDAFNETKLRKEDTNPFTSSLEVACANPFGRHVDDVTSEVPNTSENMLAESIVKDHVSVEDLLEFADQKPRGRQRGVESDEVRIMCKVLKEQVTLEDCLEALEISDWNVHQAIKLMKVKISVEGAATLDACYRQLVYAKGDIVKASAMLLLGQEVSRGQRSAGAALRGCPPPRAPYTTASSTREGGTIRQK